MCISFYQYPPSFWYKQKSREDEIQLPVVLEKCIFFRSYFLHFCRLSGDEDICSPFNNEPSVIWKYSESIWTWYGTHKHRSNQLNNPSRIFQFSMINVNLKPSWTGSIHEAQPSRAIICASFKNACTNVL